MPRFRESGHVLAAVPMMLLIHAARRLGRPMPVLALAVRRMFLSERIPAPLRGYVPQDHDVFVATFAKSGTNWALQIAQQLVEGGRAEFEHIHDVVPWPEAPMPGVIPMSDRSFRTRSDSGLRIIKTHLAAHQVPFSSQARYVTVLRDPKEVLVSSYYFVVGMFGLLEEISFDQWYAHFMNDGPMSRAWARHAAGFWDWRARPNVLILTYGEMKRDLPGTVQRFAGHLRLPLTDEVHAEVTRRAGFEYMRAHESCFGPPRMPLTGDEPSPLMMRRGKSGGSGELLSREQQAAIDRMVQQQLVELGSDLPYAELFDTVQ